MHENLQQTKQVLIMLIYVNLGQTQLICCFSDLSWTHLKGSRRIKIKGKRGKNLHENTII